MYNIITQVEKINASSVQNFWNYTKMYPLLGKLDGLRQEDTQILEQWLTYGVRGRDMKRAAYEKLLVKTLGGELYNIILHACSVASNFLQLHRLQCFRLLSRQEFQRGLPFPTPGLLPNPGTELTSPMSPALAGGFFTTEPPGKPIPLKITQS